MISVEQLVVRLGATTALAGLDLSVGHGEYICLTGPNGAGKSTLLRVLAGLVKPTSGTVAVDGRSPRSGDGEALVGYVPDTPLLYDMLTPREHLDFLGRMWSPSESSRSWAAAQEELLERFGLSGELANAYAGRLSLGQRRRLSLAVATYHRPSLLLLDEPFNGLDGATAAMLRELLAEHVATSGTVLVASHATSNVAAGRLVVLNAGRLVADRDLAPDAVVADVSAEILAEASPGVAATGPVHGSAALGSPDLRSAAVGSAP